MEQPSPVADNSSVIAATDRRGPAPIPIFIGYDPRERAATNVLIDSLYQHSSAPLAITPLVTPQLEQQGLYHREKDPKQSTGLLLHPLPGAPSDGLSGLGRLHGLRHALPR